MANQAYQIVTDRIITMLEAGTRPWAKSWTDANGATITGAMQRPLRSNGEAYTGINVINLWVAAELRGFTGRHWFTYKGAQEVGGQVRKGARSEMAFFVGRAVRPAEKEGDEDSAYTFLKSYCVFNQDEIDNLPARYLTAAPAAPVAPACPHDRNPAVDSFVTGTGATVRHGGNRAFYMPAVDAVTMPTLAQFDSAESYYATLLHELVHWTGTEARCAREFGRRFGDDAYAVEELTAELGAAFLCADLELSAEPRPDHASYLASWLRVLKADNRAIFKAASAADKAATYLHSLQPAALAEAA